MNSKDLKGPIRLTKEIKTYLESHTDYVFTKLDFFLDEGIHPFCMKKGSPRKVKEPEQLELFEKKKPYMFYELPGNGIAPQAFWDELCKKERQ
jgi:hypothetical protein